MAKGFFTQGVALLTNGRTTIDDIRSALQEHDFEIVKQVPSGENWCFGGDSLIVPFLPEVNGYAAVDVVDRPWPDSMGDPKSDSMTFAAWSMGHFGPFAFPGALDRARQHACAWRPGQSAPEGHRGFIRVRISYVFGGEDNATVMPKGYDPLAEMVFLSRAVLAVFNATGVVCYFNPNGEVLYNHAKFCEIWDACREQKKIPLPLWINIRFFNLNANLGFMDTVGNGQLEISDVEAVFPTTKYNPGEIDYYLRNVTHYLLDHEQEIKNGDAIDGPGETNLSWSTEFHKKGIVAPPRSVMRLYSRANQKAVLDSLAAIGFRAN
jgi:hypothetical protein